MEYWSDASKTQYSGTPILHSAFLSGAQAKSLLKETDRL
jgi:hypothetical protein